MSYSYPSIEDFKKFFQREFDFEPERKVIRVQEMHKDDPWAPKINVDVSGDGEDDIEEDDLNAPAQGEVVDSEEVLEPLEFNPNEEYVTDDDVVRAFVLATVKINHKLFWNQNEFTVGFLYLSAFFLANESVFGKQTLKMENSKTLAEGSISFTIPEEVTKSAHYSWLASNRFGIIYFQLIRGKTLGSIFTIPGATTLI